MKLVPKRCPHCTTCKVDTTPIKLGDLIRFRCEAFISPVETQITMERVEEVMRQMQLPEPLPYQRRMLEQAWMERIEEERNRYISPSRQTGRFSERDPREQRVPGYLDHPTSFIGPEVTDLVRRACKHDQRMDFFWTQLTGRVRTGLNDTIVRGIFEVMFHLLKTWDEDSAQRDTRNLNNIRSLGEAARDALDAFESAKDRDSVLYMVDTMEELDAALYDLTQKET